MTIAAIVLSCLALLAAAATIAINIRTMRVIRRTEAKIAATEELNAETLKIIDEIEKLG